MGLRCLSAKGHIVHAVHQVYLHTVEHRCPDFVAHHHLVRHVQAHRELAGIALQGDGSSRGDHLCASTQTQVRRSAHGEAGLAVRGVRKFRGNGFLLELRDGSAAEVGVVQDQFIRPVCHGEDGGVADVGDRGEDDGVHLVRSHLQTYHGAAQLGHVLAHVERGVLVRTAVRIEEKVHPADQVLVVRIDADRRAVAPRPGLEVAGIEGELDYGTVPLGGTLLGTGTREQQSRKKQI